MKELTSHLKASLSELFLNEDIHIQLSTETEIALAVGSRKIPERIDRWYPYHRFKKLQSVHAAALLSRER
jgi:hypothetical protein